MPCVAKPAKGKQADEGSYYLINNKSAVERNLQRSFGFKALGQLNSYGRSIFQRVGDGGDYAQFLDVRRVLVAVFNLELSLTCRLYLT